MKPDHLFWIAVAAYAVHILEEYSYDWKSWTQKILKLNVTWEYFYVTNILMLFVGVACAEVGWLHPTFSLIFPALMAVNALFFHIVPYVRSKRKYSPGLMTAIFLLLPIGLGSFSTAYQLAVFPKALLISAALGALLVYLPVIMLKTKDQSFFKP